MKLHVAVLAVLCVAACSRTPSDRPIAATAPKPKPPQAGQPLDPVKTAAHITAARVAAIAGNPKAAQRNIAEVQEDFRRSIALADPARAVDRESARRAAKAVPGVRSAVWIDRENLLVIVDRNDARSYDTIDAICVALDPLGDTLGVVVNLQSGAATNGDELEIVSRNCQLEPGQRAMLQKHRQVDVIPPEIRAQHKAARTLEVDAAAQAESLKVLEASTPQMQAPVQR
jgi:hypothetical protein